MSRLYLFAVGQWVFGIPVYRCVHLSLQATSSSDCGSYANGGDLVTGIGIFIVIMHIWPQTLAWLPHHSLCRVGSDADACNYHSNRRHLHSRWISSVGSWTQTVVFISYYALNRLRMIILLLYVDKSHVQSREDKVSQYYEYSFLLSHPICIQVYIYTGIYNISHKILWWIMRNLWPDDVNKVFNIGRSKCIL